MDVAPIRRKSHTEAFWADPTHGHITRCTATLQKGTRCRGEAVAGSVVCPQHGGAAGQVRRRAAERTVSAADEAIQKIIEFINDPNLPAGIRLKAAQDIADRAGLAAQQIHRVVADDHDPVLSLLMGLAEDGGIVDTDDIVDAEVVEDDDEPAPALYPPSHREPLPTPEPPDEDLAEVIQMSSRPPSWLGRDLNRRNRNGRRY